MHSSERKTKIAMVVPNPCDPDYRVVKQAETLAKAGYEIRVYCGVLRATSSADEELVNGVTYIRRVWAPLPSIKAFLVSNILFWSKPDYAPKPSIYFGTKKQQSNVKAETQNKSISAEGIHSANNSTSINNFICNKISSVVSRIIFRISTLPKTLVFQYLTHISFRYVFEREIVDWAPDVIHAHDGTTLPLAGMIAEKTGCKFIYDSHELEAHRSPPLPWVKRKQVIYTERKYLPKADAVTTVGYKIAEKLAKEYNITQPIVIYNAPPKIYEQHIEEQQILSTKNLRTDAKLDNNDVALVYTGNVTVNRGLEETIDALQYISIDRKEFARKFGTLKLVVVGSASDRVKAQLKARLLKKSMQANVIFLDPVTPQNVFDYISMADIAVIPIIPAAMSYEYAMPNKLFEAILARLPILGSRLTEMSEVIKNYNLGRTFAPGNKREFSDGLWELLENRSVFLGSQRDVAIDYFCWERQEEKLLKTYLKLGLHHN